MDRHTKITKPPNLAGTARFHAVFLTQNRFCQSGVGAQEHIPISPNFYKMDIQGALLQHPVSREWTIETQNIYLAFYQRMTRTTPLATKLGKGGLSFYKETTNGSVFVCHFNAKPQSNKNDLGFADFRYDAIDKYMNVDDTIQSMQKMAAQGIVFKVSKFWCSLHFPLNLADDVADLFLQNIITKFE